MGSIGPACCGLRGKCGVLAVTIFMPFSLLPSKTWSLVPRLVWQMWANGGLCPSLGAHLEDYCLYHELAVTAVSVHIYFTDWPSLWTEAWMLSQ